MNKILKNITYPVAIIIGAVVLGGALLMVQNAKQNSIEKQALTKQTDAKFTEIIRQNKIDSCISDAEADYWNYVELNGTKKPNGNIWALNSVWDRANNDKKTATDLCLKRY